jgi:hypothetical protein
MDFKTRFQGKTSKITKDGDIEGEFVPKASTPTRKTSIQRKEHTASNQREKGMMQNSKFSYKAAEGNRHITGSEPKPIEKLTNVNVSLQYNFNDQEIRYGSSYAKPNHFTQKKQEGGQVQQTNQDDDQYLQKTKILDQERPSQQLLAKSNTHSFKINEQPSEPLNAQSAAIARKQPLIEQYNFKRGAKNTNMSDFSRGGTDNIYLNGGKTIAEAIRYNQDPNSMNSSRMSIA